MKKLLSYLKDCFASAQAQAGFTMIELLVVIAVIGVLAVAVLSSIDPIEQINKGRDTRLRSNSAQLINALDRYYAIQEQYTWNEGIANYLAADAFPSGTVAGECGNEVTIGNNNLVCQVGGTGFNIGANTWLTRLATVSEVKQSFVDQLSQPNANNTLYVDKEASDDLYVCFRPTSKQFQLEAIKACVSRGASLPNGACPLGSYNGTETWTNEMICLP